MPLREVQFEPYDATLLRTRSWGERFLVFFSSRLPENNSLWCPDCLAVEDLIVDTFNPDERAPSAVLVYVGQKSEWKTADNIFRKGPWKVTAIPTIIKLDEAGKEIGRLVEGQIVPEELSSFVQ